MTTIYVTHDQREALTMSDRIAVIERRHGSCSSTRRARIYERPANSVRRGVHRRIGLLCRSGYANGGALCGDEPIKVSPNVPAGRGAVS